MSGNIKFVAGKVQVCEAGAFGKDVGGKSQRSFLGDAKIDQVESSQGRIGVSGKISNPIQPLTISYCIQWKILYQNSGGSFVSERDVGDVQVAELQVLVGLKGISKSHGALSGGAGVVEGEGGDVVGEPHDLHHLREQSLLEPEIADSQTIEMPVVADSE